jgi:hypothetical protein
MAFVNEVIPESGPYREWYESFHFENPIIHKPASLHKWTIDKNLKVFLHWHGGGYFGNDEIHAYFSLVCGCERISLSDVYCHWDGNNIVGITNVHWYIEHLSIPKKIKDDVDNIIDLVHEAFCCFGLGYRNEHTPNDVLVEINNIHIV